MSLLINSKQLTMEKKVKKTEANSNSKKEYTRPLITKVKIDKEIAVRLATCACHTQPKPYDSHCY